MPAVNRDFINDVLRHRAYNIAWEARNWPNSNFARANFSEPPEWEIVNDGIQFNFLPGARVYIKNIRPSKIKSISFGETQERNRRSDTSDVANISNFGTADLERTFTIEKAKTTTQSEELGVSVETTLRQQVSYGSAAGGVQGETEFSLSIGTAFTKFNETSNSSATTDEVKIVVPPGKRTQVTTTKNVADIVVPMTVVAEIDYDIEIDSSGDWNPSFTSIADFKKWCNGLIPRTGPNSTVRRYVTANPSTVNLQRDTTTLVENIEYQGATTGDLIVREFNL